MRKLVISPVDNLAVKTRVQQQGTKAATSAQNATPLVKAAFDNDGRYLVLDKLPTNYQPYDFRRLWVRGFSIRELQMIHMYKKTDKLCYLLSAVDACLSESVYLLTPFDFEAILYWLRVNSYPKSPMNVTWTCTAIKTKHKVLVEYIQTLIELYQPLLDELEIDCSEVDLFLDQRCGHVQLGRVFNSSLTYSHIRADLIVPAGLDYPRMGIVEELLTLQKELLKAYESLNEAEAEKLEARLFYAKEAQYLLAGATLSEKIAILEAEPDTTLYDAIQEFKVEFTEVGVSEMITLGCLKCTGKAERRLDVGSYAHIFP